MCPHDKFQPLLSGHKFLEICWDCWLGHPLACYCVCIVKWCILTSNQSNFCMSPVTSHTTFIEWIQTTYLFLSHFRPLGIQIQLKSSMLSWNMLQFALAISETYFIWMGLHFFFGLLYLLSHRVNFRSIYPNLKTFWLQLLLSYFLSKRQSNYYANLNNKFVPDKLWLYHGGKEHIHHKWKNLAFDYFRIETTNIYTLKMTQKKIKNYDI
jgi:hypothetical protein